MNLIHRLFGSLLVITVLLLNVTQANAQLGIELDLSAAYKFGEQVTFIAQTKSPIQIQNAFIVIYDELQATTYREQVSFNADGLSQFRFDTKQNSLRPFTTIRWDYEITLADGSAARSQAASFRYDDDRFDWRSRELNGLHVHWYNGDDDFGLTALNAGVAGLQKITELFLPDLSSPVDVFIYANENDLRGTLYAGGEAWTAGHADSAAGIITVTIEAGADQNILLEQRIPHELMHVMLYRQVGAGYKNIPAWLREGMSMIAELYPNPEYDRFLMDAAAREVLIPMIDLCASFSPQIDSAFLAYAQSRSFTNYLRGQYGGDGLLSLSSAYASGVDCERGTERAFGVSFAKLERDWRTSVLGQNDLASTLGRFAPYLALLCLVMLMPLIGVIGAMRKKGASHGPKQETYVKR
jgi:hypothetical protein